MSILLEVHSGVSKTDIKTVSNEIRSLYKTKKENLAKLQKLQQKRQKAKLKAGLDVEIDFIKKHIRICDKAINLKKKQLELIKKYDNLMHDNHSQIEKLREKLKHDNLSKAQREKLKQAISALKEERSKLFEKGQEEFNELEFELLNLAKEHDANAKNAYAKLSRIYGKRIAISTVLGLTGYIIFVLAKRALKRIKQYRKQKNK